MKINLNFDWKYTPNFCEEYLAKDYDDNNFEVVNIPHTNKVIPYNNFNENIYQFVSCYRKVVNVPTELSGKRLVLEFEAVSSYAEVFVNGKKAFSHKGGFTAFNGDITDLVNLGEDNTIAVMVDSTEREEIPPFGKVVDYLCYGGIYREVYLYAFEQNYIKDIMVAPKDCLQNPAKIDIKLNFNTKNSEVAHCELLDMNGNSVQAFDLNANGNDSLHEVVEIEKAITLWDIENPYLYTLKIDFSGDTFSTRFGFREQKFTNKGFFLNGKQVKIRGLNRHQSYPYVGYAMPASAQIADAEYMKFDLGLNLARTSHYPNSKHFLNRCDEIGLLVFTEIPGWQHIGKGEEWRNITKQHVREMIVQDYNHPSIILWGVRINESDDDHELYTETNKIAHELDFSRQTAGVRCFPRSELLEDVYTFNDFTHNGKSIPLMPKFIVTGSKNPLLISEHNGHMFPTKSFDHEKKRQEHAIRHARVLNEAYKRNNTCGAIGWCMSDYNTHKDFGSGDKICYHGVSDMFRMDKLAAYVYKAQQDEYPVLEISSNMEIGDNAGGQVGEVYMFTNCDTINLYKNNVKINTFDVKELAKKSEFDKLPHPPIELYDIIGDQIEKLGKFSKHDCDLLKTFLLDIKKFGTLPAIFRHPFSVVKLLLKYHLAISDITALFGQFIQGWGGANASEYKFEGIKGDKSVVVTKASVMASTLVAKADKTELVEADTYDTVRITLQAKSQCGWTLPYANDVVNIQSDGNVKILGESQVALIGGQRAFWVATCGKTGKATITLTSNIGNQTIELDVKKI